VTPVEDGPRAELLLFVPPFSISTAAVYREHAGRFALPDRLEVEDRARRDYLGPNDLASAVLRTEPRMEAYVESAGRVTRDHLISGSGSTIALHASPAEAGTVLAMLTARHPEARLYPCHTLTRIEYQQATSPTSSSSGGGLP
jgi:4-diphosphocytidyl-2C-methyl-D-erythritol kinase